MNNYSHLKFYNKFKPEDNFLFVCPGISGDIQFSVIIRKLHKSNTVSSHRVGIFLVELMNQCDFIDQTLIQCHRPLLIDNLSIGCEILCGISIKLSIRIDFGPAYSCVY